MNYKELKSLLKTTGTTMRELDAVIKSWEEFWSSHKKDYPWVQGRTAELWTRDAMITSSLVANRVGDWANLMEEYWMDIGHQCGYPDGMNESMLLDDFARYCYLCGVRDALN